MLARTRATVTMLAILAAALPAHAQPAAAPAAAPAIKLGGYLETYFQWNLRDPSNSVTALRAYDDRHDSLEIENAVIEATWTKGSLWPCRAPGRRHRKPLLLRRRRRVPQPAGGVGRLGDAGRPR